MKNKILIVIIYFLLSKFTFAQGFTFQTKNIEINKDTKLIEANFGKAISADGDLIIDAEKFIYDKNSKILNISGNGSIIRKSKSLEIIFDNSVVNENTSVIIANGNVKIIDKQKDLEIYSSSIIYNQNQNKMSSNFRTKIKDKYQNDYLVDKFNYELNKNLLKVENLLLKDFQKNIFKTSLAYINTQTNRLFGKDIQIDLAKTSFNENQPRLKGNSIINDNEFTEIKKGIFTTCKKREGCPPWQLSSDKISHDKKKKTINYKNAVLRIYDFPVMYFPKFFHPDPTVKRQSGFLIPTFSNSINSSNYINTPYFLAISENKDFTFSPRFYSNEKFLIQTEYRQVNSRSDHITDFSFFSEKNEGHLFYSYNKILDYRNFDESEINFKIQQTSNETYIRKNKINSKIINDDTIMENSFDMNLYSENFFVNIQTTAYEDLNKNKSDRYEFIIPKIEIVKNIENKTSLNGDFLLESKNLIRNYDTNVFEKSNINDLIFTSFPKINKSGFYNNYEFLIKNANTHSEKSKKFKEKENLYLTGLLQLNSSLPLAKENIKNKKVLKPKMTLKIAPYHSKDNKDDETTLDVNNIFSLNRINKTDSVEGGISLAYGTDYLILDKKNNREILGFKLANNLRLNESDDLTHSYQLNQKTSNFFTETSYSPNKFLNLRYNSSVKNNLSEISNENLLAEFKFNNFSTSFNYLNENNTKEKNSYLSNTTSYDLDKSNSLIFSTREDKTLNLTEFYKLIYQYKNDCLAASIEYNKDYYNDRDLNTSESIFFKLSIIPFGETSSPNLKN